MRVDCVCGHKQLTYSISRRKKNHWMRLIPEDKRQNEENWRYIALPLSVPITLGSIHAERLRKGLLPWGNGKGDFSKTQVCLIITYWLICQFHGFNARQTDDRVRNWWSNMLSTQARRNGSHVYRNICSYTYDPLQQKNLLIPAYMPAELAQIDFGKKLIKTFKKSQKPFSMCKKKFPFPRLKSQTKISFVPENYLYPVRTSDG